MSKFDKIDIKVDGEHISVDIADELEIADISTEMSQVAAKMGFWGNVWGGAEEEKVRVDGHYRQWRAQVGQSVMAADPKMAEWKVKQEIEAHPEFLRFKDAAAKAEGNVVKIRSLFQAFDKKANQLQSKGARVRSELEATGMVTRTPRPDRDEKISAGVSAMKEANKKKKAKADSDGEEDLES